MVWQYIWGYNYILYNMKEHPIRLIANYEKQIILPFEEHFKEVCKILYGLACDFRSRGVLAVI